MSKLKAYTIMEMMIVMLISSLVISIAFITYRILSKQLVSFQESSGEIAQIALFDRLLSNDFSKCQKVLKGVYDVDCIYKDRKITYTFEEEYILREDNTVKDTFFLHPQNFKVMFFKNEVTDVGKPIDELSFDQLHKGEQEFFSYSKSYGADVLMLADEKKKEENDE